MNGPLPLLLQTQWISAAPLQVGVISATYNTQTVLIAVGLTALVTVGLTVFACQVRLASTQPAR